jgi:hypothetical protein
MFVRCVRATVTVLAFAWAGPALAQDAPFSDAPEFSSESSLDETYVADPNESFVVEHSGQVAAAAPRREPSPPSPSPSSRCREYSTDEDDGYGRGLACPQPDGSWRIVESEDDAIQPRPRESQLARNRAPYTEYPDYADEARDEEPEARPARRFRLDWNAWSSGRRDPRNGRNRYNE